MDYKAGNKDPIRVQCTIKLLTHISGPVQFSVFNVDPYHSTLDADKIKCIDWPLLIYCLLRFSNSLGPDQADRMPLLIWIQTVCLILELSRVRPTL